MSGDLAHIARCLDLQERDIAFAVVAREGAKALVEHLATRSAPNTGVAKVLLVFARMATTACDWIDGDLGIDLTAVGDTTRVDVVTGLGGGLRERVFPPLVFRAPLEEFARALERAGHMVAPLRLRASTRARIALGASEAARRTSLPPPPIEISADSLFLAPRSPLVPREPDDGGADESLPVVVAAAPTLSPGASESPGHDLDSGWDD